MNVEEITQADKAGAHFTVSYYPGIAFYFYGVETEPDEDTHWSGYEVPTGNVLMVIVGDGRKQSVDPQDVEVIPEDSYCPECGQIGCTALKG